MKKKMWNLAISFPENFAFGVNLLGEMYHLHGYFLTKILREILHFFPALVIMPHAYLNSQNWDSRLHSIHDRQRRQESHVKTHRIEERYGEIDGWWRQRMTRYGIRHKGDGCDDTIHGDKCSHCGCSQVGRMQYFLHFFPVQIIIWQK